MQKIEHNGAAIPRKRPYLISLSGMDGSGKTTQIDALLVYLRDAGLRVRVLRFWDDIAVAGTMRETLTHKLFKRERGVGSPEKPVQRRDKNVRGWYMSGARSLLYSLDAARLAWIVASLSRKDADVVIFDRYLHDQLVNLNLQNPATRAYVRGLLKTVPHPDIAFLLDADPVQARARKPEYPLEFLQSVRASYALLTRWGGLTPIDALPPQDVTRSILRCLPPVSVIRATDGLHPLALPQAHQ